MGAIMENYAQPARFSKGKICNVKRINKADVDMSYRSCHRDQAAAAQTPPPPPEVPSELTDADLLKLVNSKKDGFQKWANQKGDPKQSGISKFMWSLKSNPERIWTESEFKKELPKFWKTTQKLPHFTSWRDNNGVNGYGPIMKKVGDTYQMYPELVEHYKKFFN